MHYFLSGNITLVLVKNPENKCGSLYCNHYISILCCVNSIQNTSAEEENYQADLDDEGK